MRFCLEFTLDDNEIPLDYRSCFLSYLKNAFLNYDKDIFNDLYHSKDPIKKPFTFSVYLGKAKFEYKTILLEQKKFKLNFSTNSPEYGINFYNAMLSMKEVSYPFGSSKIQLKNFNIIKEKPVTKDLILLKTMSPVVIRKHDNNKNYDNYYGFKDEEFLDVLKENILNSTKTFLDFDASYDIGQIGIIPVEVKETKVLYHGHKIKANLGTFVISAKSYLIDYLVKIGIGSRRSQGFGMVNIESEVKR